MVSTASSTVNVFCPEHQRERKTETKKTSQQSNCTSFLCNVNIFHATVRPHQEKGWKHLPVVCPLTSYRAHWWPGMSGDTPEGQPCTELPQLLQKPTVGTASGQWSTRFPCPNCREAQSLCTPGVWTCSQHGWCELGAALGPSTA